MKDITVLGTGCANCKSTLKLIEEAAKAKGVDVRLEKVEDLKAIMGYGVMSTPALVVDGVELREPRGQTVRRHPRSVSNNPRRRNDGSACQCRARAQRSSSSTSRLSTS